MFSFQRSNTPYTSIFPFNAKKLAYAPEPILPLKTPKQSGLVVDKMNRRKPGTRKPRVVARYVEAKPMSVDTVSPVVDSVRGFEHIFNKPMSVDTVSPVADSVRGFEHIFNKPMSVDTVSPVADSVRGFEHIFNKQKPVITPDSDRVIGISHLFK